MKKKLILTDEQNKKWLDSLRSISLDKQLNLILERIVLDTNVFIKYSYADGLRKDYTSQEKTKFEGCCKPIIIIEPTNTVFRFDDKFETINLFEKVTSFKDILNKIIVDEVRMSPQNKAVVLWGSSAENGAIVLKVSDKHSLRLLKKKFNYHR